MGEFSHVSHEPVADKTEAKTEGSARGVALRDAVAMRRDAGIDGQSILDHHGQSGAPAVDAQGARARAREIKAALLDGWTEDEEKALDQIRQYEFTNLEFTGASVTQACLLAHLLESTSPRRARLQMRQVCISDLCDC